MRDLVGTLVALLGALLVGWNGMEVYYLMTGRVRPGPEQAPLAITVLLLIIGLVLMFGGWALHRRRRKDDLF